MDYYISRHTDTNFDSIVCCGLGARVKGLMLLLTNELGQQVDVLQEFKNFALPAGGDAHNVIKKHEKTRADKELDRINHVD